MLSDLMSWGHGRGRYHLNVFVEGGQGPFKLGVGS